MERKSGRSIQTNTTNIMNRRRFFGFGTGAALGLAGCGMKAGIPADKNRKADLSFGVITDLHYADKETWGTRHYRDSLAKLTQAATTFEKKQVAFAIELGDIIDKADKDIERSYLATISEAFGTFPGPRHFVLGNHDVATFSKEEFLAVAVKKKSFYSFDMKGWHFVVLDACFNADFTPYNAGNFDWTQSFVPPEEIVWLADDLAKAQRRNAIVFIHQILNDETDPHGVKNAPAVRAVLEGAGNVRAVFQGHMHTGGYAAIGGIHYITLRAAVEEAGLENNSCAVVTLFHDGAVVMDGYGRLSDADFPPHLGNTR